MESIDNITERQSSDLREWLSSLYMEFSPEKYSRHRCLRQSVIGCQDSQKCSPNLG